MDSQATAGRNVHYTDATGRSVAAIVCVDTAPDGMAALMTMFPDKMPVPMKAVPYSEPPAPGCWSWMPYQKARAATAEGNISESAEPRPATRMSKDYAAHLNDLNERVEALEVAAEKEALARTIADPRVSADSRAIHGGGPDEGQDVPAPIGGFGKGAKSSPPESDVPAPLGGEAPPLTGVPEPPLKEGR